MRPTHAPVIWGVAVGEHRSVTVTDDGVTVTDDATIDETGSWFNLSVIISFSEAPYA